MRVAFRVLIDQPDRILLDVLQDLQLDAMMKSFTPLLVLQLQLDST